MRFDGKLCLHIILLLTFLLLGVGCTDDAPSAESDVQQAITFEVTEDAWKDERVQITRSDATMLEGLKAADFGLYCSEFNLKDKVVRWNGSRWDYGDTFLWPVGKKPTISVYAYAPFLGGGYDPMDRGSVEYKTIEFPCGADNGIDLLWANQIGVVCTGEVTLNFQHALGKLTLGTVTNNYGCTVTLTNISLSGFYDKGNFSLMNGTWTNTTGTHTITRSLGLTVADGEAKNIGVFSVMQIPCDAVAVVLTFTSGDFGTKTVTFNTTLEQGKNRMLNITITNNFEVVIAP